MSRKRPSVSLARPVAPPRPDLDNFVTGAGEPDARPGRTVAPSAPTRAPDKRGNMERRGRHGAELRRVNAWVPAEVAERLEAFVASEHREKGAIVGDAIAAYLDEHDLTRFRGRARGPRRR